MLVKNSSMDGYIHIFISDVRQNKPNRRKGEINVDSFQSRPSTRRPGTREAWFSNGRERGWWMNRQVARQVIFRRSIRKSGLIPEIAASRFTFWNGTWRSLTSGTRDARAPISCRSCSFRITETVLSLVLRRPRWLTETDRRYRCNKNCVDAQTLVSVFYVNDLSGQMRETYIL